MEFFVKLVRWTISNIWNKQDGNDDLKRSITTTIDFMRFFVFNGIWFFERFFYLIFFLNLILKDVDLFFILIFIFHSWKTVRVNFVKRNTERIERVIDNLFENNKCMSLLFFFQWSIQFCLNKRLVEGHFLKIAQRSNGWNGLFYIVSDWQSW